MKIVIVRTTTHIVDLETYNCQEVGLAKALSRKGHKAYIITPDHRAEHIRMDVDGGLPVDIYKVTFVSLNKFICWHKGVGKILKEIRPDLININSFCSTMCLYYAVWRQRHGCKAVAIQGNYRTTQKPVLKQLESLFLHTIGKYILDNVDGVGAKTVWAGNFVQRFKKTPFALTRIGLDVTKFENPAMVDWRERLCLANKKVLLYVGVQEPRRNPCFLVDVLSKLPEEYVLLLVGAGPQIEEVNRRIASLHLTDRVLQLGKMPQSELPSLYEACDLFLLASSYEIYGMVLLEAMYFGLPVVSTLTAGSDCIIENGKDSIIMPRLDSGDWSCEIVGLLSDRQRYKAMKEAARNKIRNNLVWNKTVDEFLSLYRSALEK